MLGCALEAVASEEDRRIDEREERRRPHERAAAAAAAAATEERTEAARMRVSDERSGSPPRKQEREREVRLRWDTDGRTDGQGGNVRPQRATEADRPGDRHTARRGSGV